jgi:hypothetical protein
MPVEDRADAFGQIRRRFLGPVVVLVAKGDKGGGYLDDAATLLTRPFSTEELGAALAVLGRPASPSPWFSTLAALSIEAGPPAAASTAVGTPAPPAEAPSGRLDLVDRVQRLRITLTQGWQARRRIRVAGFSAFALVAFTVAFALASQGGCGPGCDAFGTGFSPAPTIAPAESRAPSTTGPKRSTTTTAGSLGTSAARGISDGRLATTTTARRATTTTVKPTGGSSGTTTPTRPPTTLPPTTQAPTTVPTTQPPTTTAPPPVN